MPAGDANRTWFPEMIAVLGDEWHRSMSWTDVILFRDRLDEMLQTIRTERIIQPPMMWCKKCQKRHRAAPAKVSVRALILALRRFGVEDDHVVKEVEKGWKKYRKENGLDLYGKPEGVKQKLEG